MSEKKTAVILAGGKGTRLRPYTIAMPKPLVPVGDYPIMEIMVRQLSKGGFERIIMAVNHQADLICAYFGDGSKWGVAIEYSMEQKPLGTMGPLRNVKDLPESFLVMNGDVLTDLDFDRFLRQHESRGDLFTISGYQREHTVDYGVLHADDRHILTGFEEKPRLHYTVSMGVYALSRRVLAYIPENTYYGFDMLMHDLIDAGQSVRIEEHAGCWLDIGRPEDYERATAAFEENMGVFLK